MNNTRARIASGSRVHFTLGRKVLLLEQHNVVGGLTQSYSRNGYRWTVRLHYIGDVGSSQTPA